MKQSFKLNKRYVLTFFPDSTSPDNPADFSIGINQITHCNIIARKLFAEDNGSHLYLVILDENEKCLGLAKLKIFGDCVYETPHGTSMYNGQLILEITLQNKGSKVLIIEAGNKPTKRFRGLFGNHFPKSVRDELEKVNLEFIGYHYITPAGKKHIKKED